MATLTVYPDIHPESTSVDGRVERVGGEQSWASIRGGAGTGVNDSNSQEYYVGISYDTPDPPDPEGYTSLTRSIFLFKTSTLGAGATISAAIASFRGGAKSGGTGSVNVFTSNPVSNTILATGDYGSLATVAQSTKITIPSFSTTAYNDFILNDTGLSNISKTNVTKFGLREADYDAPNTDPGFWGNTSIYVVGYFAGTTANTSYDPTLVITYTLPAVADKFFFLMR